ncbi:MAG: GNAT family N-acetyltransferase [Candidatus Micrarchaeota archaeon]
MGSRHPDYSLPKKIALKDGRTASVAFLSRKDSVRELREFINSFVSEGAYLAYDRKMGMKQEAEWKKAKLAEIRKGDGQVLVARVGGKIAGTCDARRGGFKGRDNVCLGIAIASGFRGAGLGEALLRLNIEVARIRQKPRNIYLSVQSPNRPARALYRKLGFREFAVFPKWLLQDGKYVDHVFMKL